MVRHMLLLAELVHLKVRIPPILTMLLSLIDRIHYDGGDVLHDSRPALGQLECRSQRIKGP